MAPYWAAKPGTWLAAAGLRRVTVSLDSIDDTVFMAMNDVDFGVQEVLDGIAAEAGLTPIKINMVVQRGVNDGSILDMARHFKGSGHTLRFIEYMDVGTTNGWRLDDVVPARDIVEMLDREFGIEPVGTSYRGEHSIVRLSPAPRPSSDEPTMTLQRSVAVMIGPWTNRGLATL